MPAEDNKELIRRAVEEVWIKHDLDALEDFVTAEQLQESREHTKQFLEAFPDVRVTIEDLVAEGDKVVARLHIVGTNDGPFAGQPPTGKRVSFASFRIYRIENGKIAETWAMQDRLGLMEQLGLVQSTAGEVNWASAEDRPGG